MCKIIDIKSMSLADSTDYHYVEMKTLGDLKTMAKEENRSVLRLDKNLAKLIMHYIITGKSVYVFEKSK